MAAVPIAAGTVCGLLLAGAGVWAAEPLRLGRGGGFQSASIVFVPELVGALTLDLGLPYRFDGLIDGYDFGLPESGADVAVGWRHYLDPWGRTSLGANLGLILGAATRAGQPDIISPHLGVTARLRGVDERFRSFALGAFAEAGPLLLDGGRPPPDFPELAGESTGFRWRAGVETGPGMLAVLNPYIFGEITAQIGLEGIRLGGIDTTSVIAGLRLGLDWAFQDPTPEWTPDESAP